jgi:hypothetical protein
LRSAKAARSSSSTTPTLARKRPRCALSWAQNTRATTMRKLSDAQIEVIKAGVAT